MFVANLRSFATGFILRLYAGRFSFSYSARKLWGIRFKLGRWLYALFWIGTDRPGLLFEQTVSWLMTNKILLPGITTLERFIAEIRSRMDTRLWRACAICSRSS